MSWHRSGVATDQAVLVTRAEPVEDAGEHHEVVGVHGPSEAGVEAGGHPSQAQEGRVAVLGQLDAMAAPVDGGQLAGLRPARTPRPGED